MTQVSPGDALIVVDMQQDFLPGGALGVAGGDAIVATVNAYSRHFAALDLPVVFSRDWHPPPHCSFKGQGGPWPPHCVADTPGAKFANRLNVPPQTIIVSKGTRADRDAYSAFEDTHLAERLWALQVNRVFICGLATDYCVKATAHSALDLGFEVVLLADAMRPVDLRPGDGDVALAALVMRNAQSITLEMLT